MASTVIEARGHDAAVAAVMEEPIAAVAWGGVIGGAFVIAALSLILLALGAGFGLSTVSPWPGAGASLTTFSVEMAVWLIIVQWLSSAIGGYVAGRVGATSSRFHAHEAYFRDTVHGLLAWAVAAVVSAGLLASAATALLGGGPTAQGAADKPGGANAYFADELYRTAKPDSASANADVRAEAGRILTTDISAKAVPDADKAYLAQSVSAHTGNHPEDARRRVDDTITQARQAADATRKATAQLALFAGFSMLIGAFIAGVAAKIGGHHRDRLAAL